MTSESRRNGGRFDLVAANSLAVVNPDYEIDFDLTVSVARITNNGREVPLTVEVQAGGQGATQYGWQDKLTLSQSGEVRYPTLFHSLASGALSRFGSGTEYHRDKVHVRVLEELPESVRVTVLGEFKRPLAWEDMKDIWNSEVGVFLLSGARPSAKPLSWDLNGLDCMARGFNICGPEGAKITSPSEQFRRWVALLGEEDKGYLEPFGLTLEELRAAAAKARIHGLIVTGEPEIVLRFAEDYRVKRIDIVSVIPYES
ncbi:hypothetical protein [Nonomuraea sp. NPDC023979]|uniref:hypothetical protein n=1 Tax=Nonomuraea sp. NPDC023979 TaxID=3154796 RepID=UPI0033CAC8FC